MINCLENTFLFFGMDRNKILSLISKSNFYERNFVKGDVICSENSSLCQIGFIKSGECVISRKHGDGVLTPLNVLKKNSSFGILSAFGYGEDFPTTITCKKDAKILFIEKHVFLELMRKDSEIAYNVASFLADRVAFLNKKLNTFTSSSVTEKLASFLLSEIKAKNSLSLTFNVKRTSEVINTGRASLYRAIEKLVNDRLIQFDNKKIIIIDQEGLRRIK